MYTAQNRLRIEAKNSPVRKLKYFAGEDYEISRSFKRRHNIKKISTEALLITRAVLQIIQIYLDSFMTRRC